MHGIVAPTFRAKDADQARAMCHLACEMPGECCPKAARVLGEAEPDALACLDLPQSHQRRLRTNSVRERINGETGHRSRAVQVFTSLASPDRLVGAVLCERDEEWSGSLYFSERRMAELCEDWPKPEPPNEERSEEPMLVSEQAIRASPGLADKMEAA